MLKFGALPNSPSLQGGGIEKWRFPFEIVGELLMPSRIMIIKVSESVRTDFEGNLFGRVVVGLEQLTTRQSILFEIGISRIKHPEDLMLSEDRPLEITRDDLDHVDINHARELMKKYPDIEVKLTE